MTTDDLDPTKLLADASQGPRRRLDIPGLKREAQRRSRRRGATVATLALLGFLAIITVAVAHSGQSNDSVTIAPAAVAPTTTKVDAAVESDDQLPPGVTPSEDDRSRALAGRAESLVPGFRVSKAYSYGPMSTFVDLQSEEGTIAKIAYYEGVNPAHADQLRANGTLVRQDGMGIQSAILTEKGNELVVMVMAPRQQDEARLSSSSYTDSLRETAELLGL